jgi:hypothetical protein
MVCLLETMLSSTDYRSIDEPLFTAVDLFERSHGADPVLPKFVLPAFRSALSHRSLNLKRALWLMLLRVCPPVEAFVLQNARKPECAQAFLAWLAEDVERLFHGGYSAFDQPLDEFVSAAQVVYNSL